MKVVKTSMFLSCLILLMGSCQKRPQAGFTYEIATSVHSVCQNSSQYTTCKDVIFTSTSVNAHSLRWTYTGTLDIGCGAGIANNVDSNGNVLLGVNGEGGGCEISDARWTWTVTNIPSLSWMQVKIWAYSKNGKLKDSYSEIIEL